MNDVAAEASQSPTLTKGSALGAIVGTASYIRTAPKAEAACQVIPGASVDAAIGKLVVEAMTPMAVEVALVVWQEIQQRHQDADRLRQRQVERAQYEADLARLDTCRSTLPIDSLLIHSRQTGTASCESFLKLKIATNNKTASMNPLANKSITSACIP